MSNFVLRQVSNFACLFLVASAVMSAVAQPAQVQPRQIVVNDQKVSNRSLFLYQPITSHPAQPLQLQVTHLARNVGYPLQIYRTGYHANDAYTAYLEMGSPKEPTVAQVAHLN